MISSDGNYQAFSSLPCREEPCLGGPTLVCENILVQKDQVPHKGRFFSHQLALSQQFEFMHLEFSPHLFTIDSTLFYLIVYF